MNRVVIGKIENNNILYDEAEDSVQCKNLKVSAKDIVEAYDSPIDRVVIPSNSEKELIMRKFQSKTVLGCFTLTVNEGKNLIKLLKNARNKK